MHIENPYQYWLAERVETVKLPFRLNFPTLLEEESEREKVGKSKIVEKGDWRIEGREYKIVRKLKQERKHTRKIR